MAVYTKRWVASNLSAFLDGEHASAIVTLGEAAIQAKEEEAQLEDEIDQLRKRASDAEKLKRSAEQKVERLAREAQNEIVSQLQEFDYQRFTRNRFSLPRVKDDLRQYRGEFPDANDHAEALKRLGEGTSTPVSEITAPPTTDTARFAGLGDLLRQTPTRVALAALDSNSTAQSWVERGIELHQHLDECLFCGGELTQDRRRRLGEHFDESWLSLRAQAQSLQSVAVSTKTQLQQWVASFPDPKLLSQDLQAVFEQAMTELQQDVGDRLSALDRIAAALAVKAEDPSKTPEEPEWERLQRPLTATVIREAITQQNDLVRRHKEISDARIETVLHHLLGTRADEFRELEAQSETAIRDHATSVQANELAQRSLTQVRQKQFSSSAMAETLTRDLARVYGKHHLSVAVTDDGKSYICRRGDEPATHLSDGERTTLALLYFLRSLEDESRSSNAENRVVVIDDPSSSLDREALFATHQWLIDTLGGFGQYVILTHDFGLLRLFVKSHKNAWGKSLKRIREGVADESSFPSVSFLEVFASSSDGHRKSKVGSLPKLLLSSTSEYAYLFSMVMGGVGDSEDHERLFLLPNAARRVLEVFASYKAPHLGQFDQQLKAVIDGVDGDAYRDVYDFCNRYSHGEGNESIDVLDARAVHAQIRRCMEFLKAADSEHFSRMCKATGVDEEILA